MTDHDLFDTPALQVLEPPPGGLARVRETIDRPRSRRWFVAISVTTVAAVVAAIVLVLARSPRRPDQQVSSAFAPLVADPSIAADARVSFHWVASQPAGPSTDTPRVATIDAIGRPPALTTP
jgi:hypothetical protein